MKLLEDVPINADIVTFGKVIGGGLPVGAFASTNQIMDKLAPEGDIYQAGTLSGNPIAMEAGYTILNILNNDTKIFKSLDRKTQKLHFEMESLLNKSNIPFSINSFGSMISLHFTEGPVIDFNSSALGNNNYFKKYFHEMLNAGIYLPPSPFESYFLNDALSYEDIDYTLNTFENVLKRMVI